MSEIQQLNIRGADYTFHGMNAFSRLSLATLVTSDLLTPIIDAMNQAQNPDGAESANMQTALLSGALRSATPDKLEKLVRGAVNSGCIFKTNGEKTQKITSIELLESATSNDPVSFMEVIVRFYVFQLGDVLKEAQSHFSDLAGIAKG